MRRVWLAALVLPFACAAPPLADAGASAIWGYVTLVPKAGAGGGDAYADRRVRNAAHFDYTRPKFAVVYAPGTPAPPAPAQTLAIEDGRGGAHWAPALAAIARGESLQIRNHSARPHVVSAPLAGFVRELAPGEAVALTPSQTGELEVHTLDTRGSAALVWVAPGAYAVADAAGRYELRGLPPGRVDVRAWHPRLPPSGAHAFEARPGEVTRLDLEIGVGQPGGDAR